MHKKSVVIIVPSLLAAAVLASTDASATKVTISGTHSRWEIEQKCIVAGGQGYSNGYPGTYGCKTSKGTSVDCSYATHKCTGTVPRRSPPSHGLGGILRPPSGGFKASGGTALPQGHDRPVRITGFRPPAGVKTLGGNHSPPVTIMRTAGHHSGGHK